MFGRENGWVFESGESGKRANNWVTIECERFVSLFGKISGSKNSLKENKGLGFKCMYLLFSNYNVLY